MYRVHTANLNLDSCDRFQPATLGRLPTFSRGNQTTAPTLSSRSCPGYRCLMSNVLQLLVTSV